MTLPRIAITMGDPAGIGPEISLKIFHYEHIQQTCVPIIIGDACVLNRVARHLELPEIRRIITAEEWSRDELNFSEPAVVDLRAIEHGAFSIGVVNASTGAAAYAYINASIDAALAGKVAAVTTGPIHKEALHAAGVPYPGHTEIYAAKTGAEKCCMMLTCEELTCSFVTTHVGYRDVPELLSSRRIQDVIELTHETLVQLDRPRRKIIVCGLNPHAGEHGLFGDREEERLIVPAIEAAQAAGIDVEGPLPPDTAFLRERREVTGCFVCMYHDQGHIPLKALAFDIAVNVTLGLPIVRTSVDHGTALDIAWQGKAQTTSLTKAVELATKLAISRSASPGIKAAR